MCILQSTGQVIKLQLSLKGKTEGYSVKNQPQNFTGQGTAGFILFKVPCKTRWTEVREFHTLKRAHGSWAVMQERRKMTSQNLGCHTEENNHASGNCLVSFCRDTAPDWCFSSLEMAFHP